MEHKFDIEDDKGRKVGECFLLKSSSNPLFYLALDGASSDLTVRGMVSLTILPPIHRDFDEDFFSLLTETTKPKQ